MVYELEDPYRPYGDDEERRLAFQSPVIQVVVGPEGQWFSVHEKLLKRSPFFTAALSKGWKENQEHRVTLPEDCPRVFSHYLRWIYNGTRPNTSECEWTEIVKSYVLGEKLGDQEYQDSVIDWAVHLWREGILEPEPAHIQIIYEGTPVGSPARRLMVDLQVANAAYAPDLFNSVVTTKYLPAFWDDLCKAVCARLRRTCEEDLKAVHAGVPCSYHTHGDRPCQSKTMKVDQLDFSHAYKQD